MRLDMSPITPHDLHGKKHADIQKIALQSGNRTIALGDLFELRGRANSDVITIKRAHAKLDFIGHAMRTGTIRVNGSAGDYLGGDMQGGRIVVTGSIGAWGGAGMKDGHIEIKRHAGDSLGAARAGQPHGMAGGIIHVHGNAGDRLGDSLRRGIIVVGGDSGEYSGCRMLAGTIVVLGRAQAQIGFGMRRGTIIVVEKPQGLPVTFNCCGIFELGVTRLIFKYLHHLDPRFKKLANTPNRLEKSVGDLGVGGKGELLRLLDYETQ